MLVCVHIHVSMSACVCAYTCVCMSVVIYACVCMCVYMCIYVCALLVRKSQDLGFHNFYFSWCKCYFFNPLNLGFVVAIIPSTKTDLNNNFFSVLQNVFLSNF